VTIEEWAASAATPEQARALRQMSECIRENLGDGFQEHCDGKMVHWSVPLSVYPAGYHCSPGQPLAMLSLGPAAKGITLHHFGMYVDPTASAWFQDEHRERTGKKADMGSACIRFKDLDKVPYDLVGEFVGKVSMDEFVASYAALDPRNRKK